MKEAKPKPKKKKANKKAYYVSPKEFLGRLTEYYKTDNLEDLLPSSSSARPFKFGCIK